MKKKKKLSVIILSVLLALSIAGNLFQVLSAMKNEWIVVDLQDANSRETYFSLHNIKEAWEVSKGAGVKVGILDWGFGFKEHERYYAGGRDFSGNDYNFNHVSEHGYWMRNVLKEIAPECEVYALGTFVPDDESKWVDALSEALDWAIENDIDILTLSHQKISDKNRARFDVAVNKAVEHNIVTTFIHYGNPNNILPDGFWSYDNSEEERNPDINIFHYDYNTLFVTQYLAAQTSGVFGGGNGYIPFLSVSSMSPVTAGFIAILKGIDNSLTPAEYKDIMQLTSYRMHYKDAAPFGEDDVERVADIGKAAAYLQELNS